MFKEELLKEILDFVEKKNKYFFTKEELLVHLYYKYRLQGKTNSLSFESIIRKLRKLAQEGFLLKKYKEVEEWGFTKRVVYYPVKTRIKSYLLKHAKS